MKTDPRQPLERVAILVVEDCEDDLLLTLRILRRYHLANRIAVARDGAEALDLLFCSAASATRGAWSMPGLVLLDLRLPKIDGLEVLQRIRADERTRRLPVVVLASSEEEEARVRSHGSGATDFVRKPVEFGALAAAVRRLGIGWMLVEAPAPAGPAGA